MPCIECDHPETCRAHILPAAAGKDIIKSAGGKTLSLVAPDQINNSMQSGFFDDAILCSKCDGYLNRYDKHAVEILRLAGGEKEIISADGFMIENGANIDHQSLALFAAAVVWRASVSKRIHKLSGFTLGPNESRFQEMIFRKISAVPDVVIARIVGGTTIAHDAARAAMSYPVAVRSKSHGWMARFSLRGFMFLVRTSREAEPWMRESAVTMHGQSAGPTRLIGHLMPFEQLGDLPQIETSRYVQQMLNGASEA